MPRGEYLRVRCATEKLNDGRTQTILTACPRTAARAVTVPFTRVGKKHVPIERPRILSEAPAGRTGARRSDVSRALYVFQVVIGECQIVHETDGETFRVARTCLARLSVLNPVVLDDVGVSCIHA